MSHEITDSDKLFTVRKPSWHGLEELLPEYPSRNDAEKLVHNFNVLREPLYRQIPLINEDGEPDTVYRRLDGFELNVRSDNATPLAVVPADRVEVQPSEVWDLAELIQGHDKNVLFETAGTLRQGKDIWILIRLNEPVEINGDPNGASLPYFALQNSYELGAAFRGQASNVRIVCANTSRASDILADAQGVNFSFAHTLNLHERVEQIQEALAGWRHSITEWKLAKEMMLLHPVTPQQANWFIEAYLPMPHLALRSERVMENVELARTELALELYSGMNTGITGTALGLFEAASSWTEHIRRAQTPLSRFKRAMLEPSDVLEHAHHLAMEATRV